MPTSSATSQLKPAAMETDNSEDDIPVAVLELRVSFEDYAIVEEEEISVTSPSSSQPALRLSTADVHVQTGIDLKRIGIEEKKT